MHHLHILKTPKIVKPSSLVDKVFEGQGFSKRMKNDIHYYHVRFNDVITRTSYELQIPFEILYISKKEPFYKIQELVIFPKSNYMKKRAVPEEIINAAYEKAFEALSYLIEKPKKEVTP